MLLRKIELPEHPLMGRTHYTVGLISGGVAPNVIPAEAEAEVMFRTVGDVPGLRASLTQLTTLVNVEEILEVPPVIMPTRARVSRRRRFRTRPTSRFSRTGARRFFTARAPSTSRTPTTST